MSCDGHSGLILKYTPLLTVKPTVLKGKLTRLTSPSLVCSVVIEDCLLTTSPGGDPVASGLLHQSLSLQVVLSGFLSAITASVPHAFS